MDKRIIYYVLGRLVMAETITMLIPFAIALGNWESSVPGFAVALGLSASVGLVLQANGRKREKDLSMREGLAITGFGWALATSLGMLPYVCGGYLNALDAVFESISGFTGTGATVFNSLAGLPASILFWRMMTCIGYLSRYCPVGSKRTAPSIFQAVFHHLDSICMICIGRAKTSQRYNPEAKSDVL